MASSPQKKMTLVGLTTIVAVNMMGSGIIMLPTNLAQIGAVSLLSWLVTAVGSMAIAYCFAQLGVLCPRSGGMSAYSEEAHGKSSFFMASFFLESWKRPYAWALSERATRPSPPASSVSMMSVWKRLVGSK